MQAFSAALSQHPDPAAAVGDVIGTVAEAVGVRPDLAIAFVAGHRADALAEIANAVRTLLQPTTLLAVTSTAVVGGPVEVEEGEAISLWAGRIGPVEPVRLELVTSGDGAVVVGMPEKASQGPRTLLLLSEPFSFPAGALVEAARTQYPNLTIVGGVGSASGPGSVRLVLDAHGYDRGAVGVLLPQGVGEVSMVSQGCRPIGEPLTITGVDGNLITSLGSRPAAERLSELVDAVDDADRALLAQGLHVGLALHETNDEHRHGDFLVRGVLGVDHSTAALRIGATPPLGTTLQFHVREPADASADLDRLLAEVSADSALVFTCNGRGRRLFDEPHHDAERVFGAVERGPVAGMFCAGEYGPVGGTSHVHGVSVAMLFLYG